MKMTGVRQMLAAMKLSCTGHFNVHDLYTIQYNHVYLYTKVQF